MLYMYTLMRDHPHCFISHQTVSPKWNASLICPFFLVPLGFGNWPIAGGVGVTSQLTFMSIYICWLVDVFLECSQHVLIGWTRDVQITTGSVVGGKSGLLTLTIFARICWNLCEIWQIKSDPFYFLLLGEVEEMICRKGFVKYCIIANIHTIFIDMGWFD